MDGPLGWQYVGLDRWTIDRMLREQLMYTIVAAIVDDACQDTPTLAGDRLGELTDCVSWNAERGYYEAQQQALFYSRSYGGGGVVCVVDDGRAPEEEVDPLCVRDVCGYFALPKWYLMPADAGSGRVRAGWYGQRIGRPEHYWVTPVAPPDYRSASLLGDSHGAGTAMIKAGGMRYHRSRVIPWPHRTDLDMRQARQFPNDAGWGPGVVEGVAAAYMARRTGNLRADTIMASSHFNVLQTSNVATALSTPDGGAGIKNIIQWVVDCLAETAGGTLPFTVIDNNSTLEPKSHTLAGLPQMLAEQRKFLLDNLPEYPEVRIFGGGGGVGMSGDSGQDGQWRTYYGNVASYRQTTIWKAGKFGGGQRQAHMLAMMSTCGPTGGQVDPSIEATWPNLWQESGEQTAKTRLLNSQARAIDRNTLGLTPAAMLRHDKTLAGSPTATYASLDVDDGPLPEVASTNLPDGASPNALEAASATPGTTPAAAVSDLAAQDDAPKMDDVGGVPMGPDFAADPNTPAPGASATPVVTMPADIVTEVAMAKALGMSRATFRKWATARGVKVYPVDPGTRGGHRYSGAEVLAAWQESAKARIDAAVRQR